MAVGCKNGFAFGAAAAAVLATLARAAPIDNFPINSQLPPVARISEAFEFIFSPITFSSPSDITYRLENAPKWLSIDSDSRRLFGTPSDEDVPPGEVVGVPIQLVAEDETGSTTATPTLVVSRNKTPKISIPLSEQLPKLGTYIAPSSIHFHPSTEFSFSFDKQTFRTDVGDGGLNYYAVSGDNVPLPSWITFNTDDLTFSGKTPPFESLVQPPQTFTFQLVASDVVGFASISAPFSIVVGNHELIADPPIVKLNATQGKTFEFKGLQNALKLDNNPLKPEDVDSISAVDLPPWMSFDDKTWVLKGKPDDTAESSNITISVTDKYTDTLNLTISVHFSLFLSDLPDLDLKSGDDFKFDLRKYLSNPSDIRVTMKNDKDSHWAEFNTSSFILSGSVPEPKSAKSVSMPHVIFNAASKHTNDTETKTMNIHIDSPTPSSHESSPKPSNEPEDDGQEESNKNLLWLLVIPIFLAFAGIIVLLFHIRRRRHQPRRLEVSGPLPGSFMANRPGSYDKGSGSGQTDRTMVNVVPPRLSKATLSAQNIRNSAGATNQRASRTETSSSLTGNILPHAMMAMYSRAKSPEHSVILEGSSSVSGGRSQPSPPLMIGATDEISLLSDTSLGEGDAYIVQAQSYTIPRGPRQDPTRNLSVPTNPEPFSIQNTPEIAYIAGGRHDSSSDDAVPPPIGYATQPKPAQQEDTGLTLRDVGKRISNLWKRESKVQLPEEQVRNSMHSSSTDQTTYTSILTSGLTNGAEEEEATTSMNLVAKPTIIHIPSRPGEVRQVSRRVSESSPLFGGRSLIQSPRNFGLVNHSPETVIQASPELPPNLEDFANPRNSDSSWDRIARNSLGIAYKDLITEPEKVIPRQESPIDPAQHENWIIHNRAQDLLSPGQWIQPSTTVNVNMVGIARTSPFNTSSELPRLPPTTALAMSKGEGKGRMEMSRPSPNSTLQSTPSLTSRSDKSYSSRDELFFNTRSHRQKTPGGFRLATQTPSPDHGWDAPNRPLPETPVRSRAPLADRTNNAYYGPTGGDGPSFGIENVPSKNWKSTRSLKSAKSLRSVWADEDDEDAWEDIRPPTTIDGWEDDSEGSFTVYI
ncbi:uncharacterized protein GGS22DRAFT_191907 [Annulohypoxylon maeteangense]|uniref:uncharacterized protein n=1 Tax=Annulohypoxylon maeteangense TaxID=1927788 RepID=UPI0020083138|nr:uncharacterized protein GGS22DRAFT_191907 [Annulohypoxylon maeteangense]KAI0881720.1 hypothetical protein GGS22DRAFT_191907 [Annulohypoxylon maeteangense]